VSLVSTIIPVHNRPQLLRRAVQSVLDQTYRPIEIIIVDDGSTDETFDVAKQLAAEHAGDITAIQIRNSGPGAARQAGFEAAQGKFIQFLDSDDAILPEKFALQVAALSENPDCAAAYGKTRYYDFETEAPPDRPGKRTGERIASMFPAHLLSRWWSTSTPLYRREACLAAGPWTTLRNEEDWEFECRVARNGGKLAYVDAFVSETNMHGGDRLCLDGSSDPAKLRDRAQAHGLILGHAREAGIAPGAPEMRHFAKELFLLSRQCGAAGLSAEAARLFELARSASPPDRRGKVQFVAYRVAAHVMGWNAAGRLSCALDKFRSSPA
jgi:hypothetical protein